MYYILRVKNKIQNIFRCEANKKREQGEWEKERERSKRKSNKKREKEKEEREESECLRANPAPYSISSPSLSPPQFYFKYRKVAWIMYLYFDF